MNVKFSEDCEAKDSQKRDKEKYIDRLKKKSKPHSCKDMIYVERNPSNKPISTKVISCVSQDLFKEAGIANINKTYTNIHIDSRTGSRWLGNEVVSNSTVTKDFYKYYNLTKEDVERACGGIIKGICQIPDGESYLLGLEVYENNNYTYEIQIYSNNLKAWVDGSGKINNGKKSLWWNYTPHENGVYMSLFRVYQNDDIVEEKTYLFERG